MKTYIEIEGKQVDLESHLSKARTIVTLGKNSEEAYNVIALEDDSIDLFQWSMENRVSQRYPFTTSTRLQPLYGQMCELAPCSSYL